MNILITGARGFLGRNLFENLRTLADGRNKTRPVLSIGRIFEYDRENTPEELDRFCADCDFVIHAVGVNRPRDPAEFMEGNFGFTDTLLGMLQRHHNPVPIVITSSVQATLSGRYGCSEYGRSKLAGEKRMLPIPPRQAPLYTSTAFRIWSENGSAPAITARSASSATTLPMICPLPSMIPPSSSKCSSLKT